MIASLQDLQCWSRSLSMALLLISGCATAADGPASGASDGVASAGDRNVEKIVQNEYPALVRLYTSIHQEPELSLAEEKTSARLAEELRSAGYQVTQRVGGWGVGGWGGEGGGADQGVDPRLGGVGLDVGQKGVDLLLAEVEGVP